MTSLKCSEESTRVAQVSAPPATLKQSFPRTLAAKMMPARFKKAIRNTLRNLRTLPQILPLVWIGARNGAYLECFSYDVLRYWKYSGRPGDDRTRTHLRSRIVMDYHRIEKGLSLSNTREGFGVVAAKELVGNLRTYLAKYGADEATEVAISVLREYETFNLQSGSSNAMVCDALAEFERKGDARAICRGGTLQRKREEVLAAAQMDLSRFFSSRHSVRHFSGKEVEQSLLEQAVQMAIYTPSVCNRQSGRVHLLKSPEVKREALKWQNGNRGFAELIDKVLIVTSEVECFVHPTERYQAWVDGGMFAMSLVYALHSLGLGTCCLNWDVIPDADRGLRQAVGLPDNETVIMLIAVGHLPDEFSVAASTRNSVESILTVH